MQKDFKRHTEELKGNQESPSCILGPCKNPSYSPAKVFHGESLNLTPIFLNTLLWLKHLSWFLLLSST